MASYGKELPDVDDPLEVSSKDFRQTNTWLVPFWSESMRRPHHHDQFVCGLFKKPATQIFSSRWNRPCQFPPGSSASPRRFCKKLTSSSCDMVYYFYLYLSFSRQCVTTTVGCTGNSFGPHLA